MILIPLEPPSYQTLFRLSLSWDRFYRFFWFFTRISYLPLEMYIYFKHLTRILTDASTLSRWLFRSWKKSSRGSLTWSLWIWNINLDDFLFLWLFWLSFFLCFYTVEIDERARAWLAGVHQCALGCLHFALVSLSFNHVICIRVK